MNAKAQQELYSIKVELQKIIEELTSIANGVRNDFSGIGNEKCANVLWQCAAQYATVKRKLERIDTTTVTEEFAARAGGGSH